jgi:hypothetical protein
MEGKYIKKLIYFILSFLISQTVFSYIEISTCIDPMNVRNVWIILLILIAFFAINKIMKGIILSYFLCFLGFSWGILHTGSNFSVQKNVPMTLVVLGNPGELYSEHVMGLHGCSLKVIRSKAPIGSSIELIRHSIREKSGLFQLGELRSDEKKINSHSNGYIQKLKSFIMRRINGMIESPSHMQESKIKNWLFGVILGKNTYFSNEIKSSFQITGLYHLLSVGGLHLAALAGMIRFFLRLPFSLVYCVFLFPRPVHWPIIWGILGLITSIIIVIFMGVVGYDPAIQRSVIMSIVFIFLRIFWGKESEDNLVLLCLMVQILLYPIGFLSEGNLMSWLCSLKITKSMNNFPKKNFLTFFLYTIFLQIELAIYSAAFFGQFSVIGILINPVMVGVFSVIFVLCVVALIVDIVVINQFVVVSIQLYLDLISKFAHFKDFLPWIYKNLDEFPWHIRGFFVVLAGIFILNFLKNSSINRKGGEAYGN